MQHCTNACITILSKKKTPDTSPPRASYMHGVSIISHVYQILKETCREPIETKYSKSFMLLYYVLSPYPLVWVLQTGYTILCYMDRVIRL